MTTRRDLYIITYAPTLGTGRAMRTFSCVKALTMLGPVDLAYVPHDADEPSPEYRAIDNLEFHRIHPSRGLRRAATYVGKRLQGTPAACCRGTSPEVVEVGERLASTRERGRVVVDGGAAATALMPMARRRPITYNSHNVESARVGVKPWKLMTMRHYERRLLKAAAESWMVSRADVASAEQLVPEAHLRYVPNVVDVSSITPRTSPPPGDLEPRLLMVADFRYAPNSSGRDMLIEEILPRIWRTLPAARLSLVGRGLEEWRSPDPRIEVSGFVERLDSVYESADCVVVPLVEGAGTPLKFVEALAYGVPVVATPFAAKGLEVEPGIHYLEGADADSFTSGVLSALRGETNGMVERARALAEAEYSIEALAKRIESAVLP